VKLERLSALLAWRDPAFLVFCGKDSLSVIGEDGHRNQVVV